MTRTTEQWSDRRGGHTSGTMPTTTATITIPPTASFKLTTTAPTQQHMSSPSHPNPTPPKSQKQMTKAERREQQEAQRAAKAAAKTATPQPASSKPGPSHKQNASISGKSPGPPNKSGKEPATKPGKGEPKEALYPSAQLDETPRGLRIFSHFGAPKPPVITKGDIHPVVIRLGLQFAEFKITGANARCIAMLSAFKTVRRPSLGQRPPFFVADRAARSSKTT